MLFRTNNAQKLRSRDEFNTSETRPVRVNRTIPFWVKRTGPFRVLWTSTTAKRGPDPQPPPTSVVQAPRKHKPNTWSYTTTGAHHNHLHEQPQPPWSIQRRTIRKHIEGGLIMEERNVTTSVAAGIGTTRTEHQNKRTLAHHLNTNKTQTNGKYSRKAKQKMQIPAIGCVATSSDFSTKTKRNPPQTTAMTTTTARSATGDDGSKGRWRTKSSKRRRKRQPKLERRWWCRREGRTHHQLRGSTS